MEIAIIVGICYYESYNFIFLQKITTYAGNSCMCGFYVHNQFNRIAEGWRNV